MLGDVGHFFDHFIIFFIIFIIKQLGMGKKSPNSYKKQISLKTIAIFCKRWINFSYHLNTLLSGNFFITLISKASLGSFHGFSNSLGVNIVSITYFLQNVFPCFTSTGVTLGSNENNTDSLHTGTDQQINIGIHIQE